MQKEAAKKIWLYSYGASGANITSTLWISLTGIEIDECYILTQRDLKYMLVHTPKRVAIGHMKVALQTLETETGIKGASVFGYNELTYGNSVFEHPGMKLMIEHMNNRSELFCHWLQNGTLETNKRGLLTKFMVSENLREMSKIQLLHYIEEYKLKTDAKILEMEQEYRDMEAEIYRLRDKNKDLRVENKLFREDNAMLRTVIERQARH